MNHILQSRRYIDNAKEILRDKANKLDGYYQDAKYVKMAGNTAYNGILVALDSFLGVKKKGRKSIDWYKEEIGVIDKKILSTLKSAYDILHLLMGYDGTLSVEVANS